jgi:hypothetical protein
MPTTVAAAVDRAQAALDALRTRGEDVADEWQYVTDLGTTWAARLGDVAVARGDEALSDAAGAAIERLADEAGSIDDPHKAIDWLSTFPQAALLALGETG